MGTSGSQARSAHPTLLGRTDAASNRTSFTRGGRNHYATAQRTGKARGSWAKGRGIGASSMDTFGLSKPETALGKPTPK